MLERVECDDTDKFGSWRVATIHIVPRSKFGDLWWKRKRRRTKFGSYYLDNLSDSSPLNALNIFSFHFRFRDKSGDTSLKGKLKGKFYKWRPGMRMTNLQENNNNYDNSNNSNNNNNNNNNPKPTSRIPSLQHNCESPQKMNYFFCLTSWFFFFLPLFSDFKYSTRVICIYAVSFIGIYMVSLCRKTHGKNNFFFFLFNGKFNIL